MNKTHNFIDQVCLLCGRRATVVGIFCVKAGHEGEFDGYNRFMYGLCGKEKAGSVKTAERVERVIQQRMVTHPKSWTGGA